MATEPAQPAPAKRRWVTAETLAVAPSVLGLPLAEPWRRLAAMAVDLTAVSLLSFLSGPWLALGTGVLLIVLFGNSPDAPLAQKTLRGVCRALGAVIILLAALALGHVSLMRDGKLQLDVLTGRDPSPARQETVVVAPGAAVAELLAATEQLQKQVTALKAELQERQGASASWVYQARAFANALGVTFGWSGIYFTLLAGALGGRTLGKLAFRTRAVKINGQPFTFFDAFVRQGGYVAGLAMGLIGFLKLLWEPNRQAVEDRIASTVVVKVSAPEPSRRP